MNLLAFSKFNLLLITHAQYKLIYFAIQRYINHIDRITFINRYTDNLLI